jgi:tRNA(Ile2)-agmatinylcytidine synthase
MLNYDSTDSKVLHIGFDDTDSYSGGCTTNLAFKITNKLTSEMDSVFLDYPLLVRLNPNIPWKTRGNGGICLRIKTNQPSQIIEHMTKFIKTDSDISSGANPGLAILEGDTIPLSLRQFSSRAMYDVLKMEDAEKLASQLSIQIFKYGDGLGIIGALASIGSLLEGDHTYEAIAYRKEQFQGSPRKIDKSKVSKINTDTHPFTYNNFDSIHDRVLIAPHGPDPVFCGIRGEDPFTVIRALQYVLPLEKLEGYMVFRTNQGTNMHLQNDLSIKKIGTHKAGYVRCKVTKRPTIIRGGHVLFEISDFSNNKYPVAVYEPTGLGNIASKLIEGDSVDIGIGVSKNNSHSSSILNVEYLSILKIADEKVNINPPCSKCGKRMKSEGKNKGFQCKICGDKNASKIVVTNQRDLQLGMYLPCLKAHRHLTKPLHRFGMEKTYPHIPDIIKPLHAEWFKLF